MPVTNDIVRTYKRPRAVMRDLLDQGRREDRAIAFLMISCFLIFVAQWPRLSRTAAGFGVPEGTEVPALDRLMAYELMAWLMIWPLVLYIFASLTHQAARLFGGAAQDGYGARLALFWTMMATVPLLLLHGLMAGFLGPGLETNIIGTIWLIAFVVIWVQCLREAESKA